MRRGLERLVRLWVRLTTRRFHDDLAAEIFEEYEAARRSRGRGAALVYLLRQFSGAAYHGLGDRVASAFATYRRKAGRNVVSHVVRRLVRRPATTAASVGIFTLGIG